MNKELLINTTWTKTSGSGSFIRNEDGFTITSVSTDATWVKSDYIPLPQSGTFEFDFICSVTANNQVYIQIERYDENKGTISNNAAANCISGYKPTQNITKQRFKGIIDISTFNSNTTTAYIKVRMCSGYSSTEGTFIIHNYSLRNINGDKKTPSINKKGQLISDSIRENCPIPSFNKAGFVDSTDFYEY